MHFVCRLPLSSLFLFSALGPSSPHLSAHRRPPGPQYPALTPAACLSARLGFCPSQRNRVKQLSSLAALRRQSRGNDSAGLTGMGQHADLPVSHPSDGFSVTQRRAAAADTLHIAIVNTRPGDCISAAFCVENGTLCSESPGPLPPPETWHVANWLQE